MNLNLEVQYWLCYAPVASDYVLAVGLDGGSSHSETVHSWCWADQEIENVKARGDED